MENKVYTIHFVTIADLYDFVNISGKYPFDVVLKSGHYNVDGKSLMGMYCLNLLSDIEMTVMTDDPSAFLAEIDRFIVKK